MRNGIVMSQYTCIDLCAGIGGIRRGFEMTQRFKCVLSAEIDKYACMTYEHLYHENPFNDISSDEFKDKTANLNYDVLLAGFPCQAFSHAGLKLGFKDATRGTLFFDIADILSLSRPKAFLLENVEGLTTHNKGKTIHTILSILTQELGYRVVGVQSNEFGAIEYERSAILRSAKHFGFPQKRTRTYLMGFREDLLPLDYKLPPLPTCREDINLYHDLNDLLEFHNDPKYYLASGGLQTLENHIQRHQALGHGFGLEIVNAPGIEHPIANTILATGGSGKERNLVFDPQEGIAGMVVAGKKTPLNDKGIRFMTPREWGKLQGFINYAFVDEYGNDHFSFPKGVSETQQYKQFGNSVCIGVIESLAKHMTSILDDVFYG